MIRSGPSHTSMSMAGAALRRSLILAALSTATSPGQGQSTDTSLHPLDPLSREEIRTAVEILRQSGRLGQATRFGTVCLSEPVKTPNKQDLASRASGRSAFVLLYEWRHGIASEVIVDLKRSAISSWRDFEPGDPPVRSIVASRLNEVAKADARVRAALERRGYADLSRVAVVAMLVEGQRLAEASRDRLVRGFVFLQDSAPPGIVVPGLDIYANLTSGLVDSIVERAASTRVPTAPHPYRGSRKGLKPLRVVQPKGSSITIHGSQVRWQNWRFRFGVHPRRGLELYDIGYEEAGRVRPILYRASVAEMIAPYGDPTFDSWYPRDEGDYGLGLYGRSAAVEGADAPANAVFASAVFANDHGKVIEIPRAAALYERDGGLLWRHASQARRARQLVLTSYATIDNYDYAFNWIFGQDAALEVQVQLTGIMNYRNTKELVDTLATQGAHRAFGHVVARGVNAPNHQHFFSFRLDFDIDGSDSNSVVEVETRAVPQGADNPKGEWFAMHERTLRLEREAQRDLSLATARRWKIISRRATNSLGQPTGYTLLPGENSVPFPSPRSMVLQRAGFLNHHLWVTPYRSDEMFPSGEWVNLGRTGEGLPQWTSANRVVESADIVVWYTLGVTHLPRTEDWPIMPAHGASFRLVPSGFFSRNPGLDVPAGTPPP